MDEWICLSIMLRKFDFKRVTDDSLWNESYVTLWSLKKSLFKLRVVIYDVQCHKIIAFTKLVLSLSDQHFQQEEIMLW